MIRFPHTNAAGADSPSVTRFFLCLMAKRAGAVQFRVSDKEILGFHPVWQEKMGGKYPCRKTDDWKCLT